MSVVGEIKGAPIMATATHTRKRHPNPFSIADRYNAWYSGVKSRARKRYTRFVRRFQFWSTVSFWFIVIYYAGSKGLIF